MQRLQALIIKKDGLEGELRVLKSSLGRFGIKGSLVDGKACHCTSGRETGWIHEAESSSPCAEDGFPFPDADQWQVRLDRKRFNELNNDHKSIMLEIEKALIKVHSQAKPAGAGKPEHREAAALCTPASAPKIVQHPASMDADVSLLVTEVMAEGPAAAAGLQVHDVVTAANSVPVKSLADFAALIRSNVHKQVALTVSRQAGTTPVALTLIPAPWAGQGVLGMRIAVAHE